MHIVLGYLTAADKTPNRPSLNLSNFIKVTLQTGKDSLEGLLCDSQDPRARGRVTNQVMKGKEGCEASATISHHLDSPAPPLYNNFILLNTGKVDGGTRSRLTARDRGSAESRGRRRPVRLKLAPLVDTRRTWRLIVGDPVAGPLEVTLKED